MSEVSLHDYQDHDIEKSFKEYQDDLVKASRQGLTRKRITDKTDKTGKVTTVWVKTGEDVEGNKVKDISEGGKISKKIDKVRNMLKRKSKLNKN